MKLVHKLHSFIEYKNDCTERISLAANISLQMFVASELIYAR